MPATNSPEIRIYVDHPGPSILSVHNLSYTFPGSTTPALDSLCFQLHKGEVLGVVGDSGSGKTALLQALSGIIPLFYTGGAVSGEILFDDPSIQHSDLFKRMEQIKMIFQDPSTQYKGASVDDALAFGMENSGILQNVMQQRISEITRMLHIEHLLGKNSEHLSGGERQATSIGSVLAMEPNVLLMDEVISALDVAGQDRIKGIIAAQKASGRTMVIVDSDVTWLANTVDRLLILENGKIVYDGLPKAIYDNPEIGEKAGLNEMQQSELREFHPTRPIIQVRNLSFAYDGTMVRAVNNVSLEVHEGSCTAIIGHNGSGKTTIAAIISGLKKPQVGRVQVGGIDPSSLVSTELVQAIGYVFQNPAKMFVADTVFEELAYTPTLIGKPGKVWANGYRFDSVGDKSPWDISAGQQQQLAIASVLSADPNVVIFDEPTLGQTRRNRQQLVETIKEMQAQRKTVIIISHDMNFVRQAAEYVYEMEHGRIARQAPATQYFQ